MAYTDKTFLEVLKPYVLQDMRDTGILASLTASQAFIESNKGNSGLTKKANNLFGIKGEYNGQYVVMPTTEYYNGVKTKVNAKFRKYPSWKESIADHSRLFNTNKRYTNLRGCTNYLTACKNVQADGYATSPTYSKTLATTIEKYQLYKWDAEVLGTTAVEKPYKENAIYTTQQDLYVRDNPDGNKIKYEQLTPNAKLHAKKDILGYAILKKGTRVTCRGFQMDKTSGWLHIPSGWICAYNKNNIYVI